MAAFSLAALLPPCRSCGLAGRSGSGMSLAILVHAVDDVVGRGWRATTPCGTCGRRRVCPSARGPAVPAAASACQREGGQPAPPPCAD